MAPIRTGRTRGAASYEPTGVFAPLPPPRAVGEPLSAQRAASEPLPETESPFQPLMCPRAIALPLTPPRAAAEPLQSAHTMFQPLKTPRTIFEPLKSPPTIFKPLTPPRVRFQPLSSPRGLEGPGNPPHVLLSPLSLPAATPTPPFSPLRSLRSLADALPPMDGIAPLLPAREPIAQPLPPPAIPRSPPPSPDAFASHGPNPLGVDEVPPWARDAFDNAPVEHGSSRRRSLRPRKHRYFVRYLDDGGILEAFALGDPSTGPYYCRSDSFTDGPAPLNQGPILRVRGKLFWDVEAVVGHRAVRRGKRPAYEILIKWAGWTEPTWVPESHVAGLPLYQEYWRRTGPY
ncbi:uncharacterized protein B0H18DRAFT_1129826 [Fomitopsis serialis]|uniref:uncharacterized protein n=1 Tax=Fomitopsis serialis TaxID=139415 RepID=UPI002007ED0F|nr:uncharacterized protein B0H18DRAFT_1129826 [Neoantrodia serialis]KAH9910597.1 hypothetical protein B0H18DRAFT_1129826 [Neoantrodia serialis]